MDYYRVFCPQKEAANIPPSVKIEQTYPAFVVVSGSETDITKLRERFPVEKLTKTVPAGTPRSTLRSATRISVSGRLKRNDFLVRFRSPVRRNFLDAIRKAGARVIHSLGGSSVTVTCKSEKAVGTIRSMPEVLQVEAQRPIIRIGAKFLKNLGQKADQKKVAKAAKAVAQGKVQVPPSSEHSIPGTLVASFYSGGDCKNAKRTLARLSIKISQAGASRLVLDFTSVKNPSKALSSVMSCIGLRRLEEKKIKKLLNDVARLVIANNVVTPNPGLGLTGKGQIIAVSDSGIDTGDEATIHPDFRGRIKHIESFPIRPSLSNLVTNPSGDDGPSDKFSGHGTHVAGSVLGNGARTRALGLPAIQGVAPEAQLVFQAIEQTPKWNIQAILFFLKNGQQPPASGLFGIPDNLEDLFQDAYDRGARIHNNSWGGGDPGEYDEQCEDLDGFVWNNKDFLVVVAAGNSGSDTNPPDGRIDPMSVDSPGTAKNCLTVGACENNRAARFTATYGQWWSDDYPVDPFRSDSMTDSIDDIVAFSSRGPCRTGRRKPDVIAPGTFVLSTRSSQIPSNNFAWGAFQGAKKDYMFMGGTSMAAPLVSGTAALVRQYLRNNRIRQNPSAALVKAAIIHSARYISYRHAHASSSRWADDEQGWGRVDLATLLAPTSPTNVLFVDEPRGLQTGDQRTYSINLGNPTVPLRVTLVYTDFPGEDLVNNLNLIATGPAGNFHLGNDFDNAGIPDSLNNVEGVVIESPTTGLWSIRVVASEILEGEQDFAIVISGGDITRV